MQFTQAVFEMLRSGRTRRERLGPALDRWLKDKHAMLAGSMAADISATIRPESGIRFMSEIDSSQTYDVWLDRGAGFKMEARLAGADMRQHWQNVLDRAAMGKAWRQRVEVHPEGQTPTDALPQPDDPKAESLGQHLAGWRLSTGQLWWPNVPAAMRDIQTLTADDAKQTRDLNNMSRGLGFEREYVEQRRETRAQLREAKAWVKAHKDQK